MRILKAAFISAVFVQIASSQCLFAGSSDLEALVTSYVGGSLPPSDTNVVLDELTNGLESGILYTMSRNFYGTDPVLFRAAKPYDGQVDLILDGFARVDEALQHQFYRHKKSGSGQKTIRSQFFWSALKRGEITDAFLAGNLLAKLAQMRPADIRFKMFDLLARGTQTRILKTDSEVGEFYQESADRYQDIASLGGDVPMVWPMHTFFQSTIDADKGVSVELRILLTAPEPFKFPSQQQGATDVDGEYNPHLQGRGTVEISFSRTYVFGQAPLAYSPPIGKVSFGQLRPSYAMRPQNCKNAACLKWVGAVPTLHMKINPERGNAKERWGAWIFSFDDFKMGLKTIALDLKNRTMYAPESEMFFVVDKYSGGQKALELPKNIKSWHELFALKATPQQVIISTEILPQFSNGVKAELDKIMQENISRFVINLAAPQELVK